MSVNLISDTVTQPTRAMREAMMAAQVGDDVFGQDPSINALQAYAANLMGHEAALFFPSGTMANQVAIKLHTQPLDELICADSSHVYQYENGGYAFHSGTAIHLIDGENGLLKAAQIEAAIRPLHDWLPRSRLVVLEHPTNQGGGSYYALEEIRAIRRVCTKHGLVMHLDGARLFNALVETGDDVREIAGMFETVSICLSKGLGAPVGSLLVGSRERIEYARRLRKAFGGGMRQAGFLAAAGLYALENNIDRLKKDNDHARMLGDVLATLDWVKAVRPVKTNIVLFDLKAGVTADQVLNLLSEEGILAVPFGPATIRFVTHLDVPPEQIDYTCQVLKKLEVI